MVHAHAHIRKEILSEPGVVAHLPVILSAAESEADPNLALGYRMCLRSVGSLVRPCLKHSLLRNRKEGREGRGKGTCVLAQTYPYDIQNSPIDQ